jgi:uncharacterized protein (UPF0332 family)
MSAAPPLARGQEEIRAARALLEAGFPSQAVSHAFMAGFHAATAALQTVGETPTTRTGVLSAFGRRVVREGGLDHEAGRALRKLFEDRNDVDLALAEAPPEEARAAIESAEALLYATPRWIENGRDGRPERE